MSDDKMREAFEAWISKDGGDLTKFGAGQHVHYLNSAVNNAWTGWKAAQARPVDAPADAERLDWLDGQGEAYGFGDIHEGNSWLVEGTYGNIRQAIDHERAAMRATPPAKPTRENLCVAIDFHTAEAERLREVLGQILATPADGGEG